MSTSLTPAQQAALQKFQAFAQQQQQLASNPLLQYLDPNSKGGAWTTKSGKSSGAGFGFEGMLDQINQRITERVGVEDINQLGLRTIDKPKEFTLRPRYETYEDPYGGGTLPVGPQLGWDYITTETDSDGNTYLTATPVSFDDVTAIYTDENGQTRGTVPVSVTEVYNKATGQSIREGASIDLGGWGQGPGVTYANLTFDESGKPKILTTGEDTNWFADKGPLMTVLKFTPIGPVVAAIDAAQSLYNYGDPTKAILAAIPYTGAFDAIAGAATNVAGPAADVAANSGIAGLAQDLGASVDLANKIGQVGAQGILGGTISAAKGKGFLPGARSGIVSGIASETVNQLGQYTGLDKSLGSMYAPAKSIATSGIASLASGRPFDLEQAVKGAATNYFLNQAVGAGGKALGIDPKQQAALMKFYNFAAPMIAAKRKP